MNFLNSYGLFLLKFITSIFGILLLLAGIIALIARDKSKLQKPQLHIRHLNSKFNEYRETLFTLFEDKSELKKIKKAAKEKAKQKNRLFVLNFNGDLRASQVNALREEISALLLIARPLDEVLLKLESPGGLVNAYGLAASQLSRLREANIKLTVAVDKIAASGGYLMACIANHIIAAPFAVIGSIGVIAQLPNFHRFLKEKNIDFEQITAGEYKRTLTVFGENTAKGREKMQEEVDETHAIFKNHIKYYRPQVPIEEAATGEYWVAQKALDYSLVDELKTSDDYILQTSKEWDVYEIEYRIKKNFSQRLLSSSTKVWYKCLEIFSLSRTIA